MVMVVNATTRKQTSILTDDTGAVIVAGGSSSGGDASAANQTTEIARLTTLVSQTDGIEGSLAAIDLNAGATTDAVVAGGAAGSLSAKMRRLTTDIAAMLLRWPAALGPTVAANSLPVTLSTDGQFVVATGAITETAPATDTASSGLNGRLQRIAQRLTSLIALLPASLGAKTGAASLSVTMATDDIVPLVAAAGIITASTDITRPADTTAYSANDALSNSTSAPTAGGFTLTGVARASGKSSIITDVVVTSSNPGGLLSGEVWIFDSSVTAINDNAAFAISDAEIKTLVGVVPFTTVADTNNSRANVQNLMIGVTTVGSADLRYLIKVLATYTPISGEVITVRAKSLQVN